ncbi:helix-turn-helix domain-containing protein [Nocardiopsis sp. NPDC058789]|uniref:helix-turn-helix domain-containing protein n=1 Tax=Nocardiopsis sp. NPDC058789 TaxID=3346634 RepID=UPI00366C7F17
MTRVFTVDQVAEQLQVKPSWIRARCEGREIPFTMLGGSYRFTPEHVDQIVRQYEQAPASRRRPPQAASPKGVTRLEARTPRGPNRRSRKSA